MVDICCRTSAKATGSNNKLQHKCQTSQPSCLSHLDLMLHEAHKVHNHLVSSFGCKAVKDSADKGLHCDAMSQQRVCCCCLRSLAGSAGHLRRQQLLVCSKGQSFPFFAVIQVAREKQLCCSQSCQRQGRQGNAMKLC